MFRLQVFFAALWWGTLTTLGFFVVPLLFAWLPTPSMAGGLAARLFSVQTWISVACGLLLMLAISRSNRNEDQIDVAHTAHLFIVGGMLLALLVEFAVAPRIVARVDLKLWHGLGSAMYLGQWLCAGATLWLLASVGATDLNEGPQVTPPTEVINRCASGTPPTSRGE
jgi:hypothetical protein